jgi:hypothetical protein
MIGITLTESYMMVPAASVSGYYFSHLRRDTLVWIGIGKSGGRLCSETGCTVEETDKWLHRNLEVKKVEEEGCGF